MGVRRDSEGAGRNLVKAAQECSYMRYARTTVRAYRNGLPILPQAKPSSKLALIRLPESSNVRTSLYTLERLVWQVKELLLNCIIFNNV